MKRFRKFLGTYPTQKFNKGELILMEGQVPSCAYVVKFGIIRTYSITADGLEKPISFDTADEIFPIGWVFNKLRKVTYYYAAFTDCEVYCVPSEDLISFVKSKPTLMFELFDNFITHHLNFQVRVNALEQSKASDKIINTLHFLSLKFGQDVAKDRVQIELPLTQQELANIMGLTRETTAIELKKLETAGIVNYSHFNYIIDTNKLNELLSEDYGHGRVGPKTQSDVDGAVYANDASVA